MSGVVFCFVVFNTYKTLGPSSLSLSKTFLKYDLLNYNRENHKS